MCLQSQHSPSSLRRSPRLLSSQRHRVSDTPDRTSKRLLFPAPVHRNADSPSQPVVERSPLPPSLSPCQNPANRTFSFERQARAFDCLNTGDSIDAGTSQPVSNSRPPRMIQLNSSAEAVRVSSSVDPHAGASFCASENPTTSVINPSAGNEQENDIQSIECSERLATEMNRPSVSRRVQLQSSVEPVYVPSSVEVLQPGDASASNTRDPLVNDPENSSFISDPELEVPRRNSPRGAEIIPEENGEQSLRASEGDENAAVYTFLSTTKVRELRKVLNTMQLKQQGNKPVLVARIMLTVDIRLSAGDSIAQIMASHQVTARFQSWVQHQKDRDRSVPQYWAVAPTVSGLLSMLDTRESSDFRRKKRAVLQRRETSVPQRENRDRTGNTRASARVNTGSDNINFSISEFARLCVIIRDDEDAKAALLATGQELTRSQLDAGFSRESFWGVIEGRFNDASPQLSLSLVGNVDDVDSTKPTPCHRSASFLKEKFFEARSSFTQCVENWSQSGQNETENFKSFAGTRNNTLTASGKRNMILFVCSRMGTDNEDGRFRSMCLRTIPNGNGVDEGGSAAQPQVTTSARGTHGVPSERNSRRNSGAAHENDLVEHSFVQLSDYIVNRDRRRTEVDEERLDERRERQKQRRELHDEMLERASERREGRKRQGEDDSLRLLEENHRLIKYLRYTTETLESQGHDPGTALVEIARRQQEAVLRAFRMPDPVREGLQAELLMPGDEGREMTDRFRNRSSAIQSARENRNTRGHDEDEDEIQPNI